MKTIITLQVLNLRNFKGIKSFEFTPNNNSAKIFGDNAVGKTTLFDAFTWLLYGKNSIDRQDFDIKTIDKHGNVIHNLEHEVEGVFSINGNTVKLKKVYYEKWVKERGAEHKELKGHTTDYYIDDIKALKKDFDKYITDLISEETFKLLTNALYFNEKMSWQDRRTMLIDLVGKVSQEMVLASNVKLNGLIALLGDRPIDKAKQYAKQQISEIKKQLETLPQRFDELDRMTVELPEQSQDEIVTSIEELKHVKTGIEKDINDVHARNAKSNEIIQDISIKNRKIQTEIDRIQFEAGKEVKELKVLIDNKHWAITQLVDANEKLERQSKEVKQELASKHVKYNNLKEQYGIESKKVYVAPATDSDDFICGCCGQHLPADKVQSSIEQAKAKFNNKRVETLEDLKKRAQYEVECIKDYDSKIDTLATKISGNQFLIDKFTIEFNEFKECLSNTSVESVDVESHPLIINMRTEIKALESQIGENESTALLQSKITDINTQISELTKQTYLFEEEAKRLKRIENLKQQESQLNKAKNEHEKIDFLIDLYEKTEMDMIEGPINAMFKNVNFKLFKEQVNGGFAPTCEALIEGVPYASANSAAQINAGLDIINTLQKHHEFIAPIFIDKNESVTKLIDTQAQTIGLFVEASAKELRVEI